MESSRNLLKNQDRISKLPDEILISIISRLTLREATATSVLSTCWRHLHTYITHLNFPERSRYSADPSINHKYRLDHMDMVNHVLDSHRGCRIKEFKVKLDRKQIFKKWFEFALAKKAEIIHMNIRFGEFHTLSRTLLLHGFKFLRELSLSWIDMTEEEFAFLLSNSLALESLSIEHPNQKLKNFSIVGHSKLKHFGLSYALEIEALEIRDVINLVSLKLFELYSECTVQLSNIPKLIKLDYKERFYYLPYAEFSARMPSCIRDQLELLHLSICSDFYYQAPRPLLVNMSVKLVNMKHLELVIDMEDEPCCIFLRNIFFLIEACRSLQKLIIKFSWKLSCMEFKEIELDDFFWMEKLTPKYLRHGNHWIFRLSTRFQTDFSHRQ